MPAVSHRLFALYAAALAALFLLGAPLAVLPAAASPVPLPLMTYFAREFASDLALEPRHGSAFVENAPSNSSELNLRRFNDTSVTPRDIDTFVGNIDILNNYYNEMAGHASNFRSLSARRPSRNADITEYSEQSATEANGFHDSLSGFNGILGQLAADKGLANYNRDDALETILKEVVNCHKDLLSSITEDVYALPTLGPVLGPIVYEIKCLLDEILDAIENVTDGVLNDLAPLYKKIIVVATKTACASGLQVAGLCILL